MTPRSFTIDSTERRARALALLAKLPVEPAWELLVRNYDPKRSVDANKRLWALHQAAAQVTGYSVDEMHDYCKHRFLPHSTISVGGVKQEVSGSSAKLSKKAFRDFMDQVEAFYISELGVFLGDE